MKKVAILRCLLSSGVCTGAGCMRVFNRKTGAFAQYKDEEIELVAFMSCQGCGEVRMHNQEEIDTKIEKLAKLQPYAVHVAGCVKHPNAKGEMVTCKNIVSICDKLAARGIKIIEGTEE